MALTANRYRDLFGFSCCCLFALFAILGTAIALIALALLLIAALTQARRLGPALMREPVAISAGILAFYVVGRAVVAANTQPALGAHHYAALWPWLALLLFPLVAAFTLGDTKRVLAILAIAVVGMLLGMIRMADWHYVISAITDRSLRPSFGLNPQEAALYLGATLLGWIAFYGRLVGNGRLRTVRLIFWLVAAALLIEMLLLTQSRTTLFSLAVLIPTLLVAKLACTRNPRTRKRAAVIVAFGLIAVLAVGAFNHERIAHRMHYTVQSLQAIATHNLKPTPTTSLGKRAAIYYFGFEKFRKHPIWGWGPGIEATTMLPGAPINEATGEHFQDLHDGYLEVLIRFGLVGLLLAALMALLMIRGLFQAWRRRDLPDDIGLFLTFAAIAAALFNLSDFQLTHMYNRFYTILLVGLIYGYILRARLRGCRQKVIMQSTCATASVPRPARPRFQ